jgi:hypothetical protein
VKKMTPQQIKKAQEMARNWKPTKEQLEQMHQPLTFLLSLTFLFYGSIYGVDFQDGVDTYQGKDFKEAVKD